MKAPISRLLVSLPLWKRSLSVCRPALTSTMANSIEDIVHRRTHLRSLPYAKCDTRIVSLLDLDLPENGTEEEFRAIYRRYVQQSSPRDRTSNASLLRDAVESIKYGLAPPVAFPTETVYGLGADATNEAATSGIFAAKGRPSDNPLIVHVASVAHLERLTGEPLPQVYIPVTEKFWPGPLTILLPVPASGIFARNVHPAQKNIGFRIPSSKYARFFIAAADRPIAGPSANSSGKPSPTTAKHVLDDLKGKINFILDGGNCEVGVESTVVDGLHDPPLILRPGGVSLEDFRALGREVGGEIGSKWARATIGYRVHRTNVESPQTNGIGPSSTPNSTQQSLASTPSSGGSRTDDSSRTVSYEEDENGAPRAPGMKYRHYAPQGRLILFSEDAYNRGQPAERLHHIVESAQEKNRDLKVGVISCHWPAFANLGNFASPTLESVKINEISKSLPGGEKLDVVRDSAYAGMTSIARLRKDDTTITLYNVQLGPDISTLAQSLFGVLRLFDELDCAYIFAETVRRTTPGSPSVVGSEAAADLGNGYVKGKDGKDRIRLRQARRDLEDAVIDRIEKAAAEQVE